MRFTILLTLISAATAAPVWQQAKYYNTSVADSQSAGEVTTQASTIQGDIQTQLPGYIQICREENWADCIIVNAGPCRNMNDGFTPYYNKNIHSIALASKTACRLWTGGCRKGLGIEVVNTNIANLAWVRPNTKGFHNKVVAFQCWQSKAKPAILAADRN
ncbi:hypothetical protein B0J11DRAFT_585279 [Dendryphion nanum]|uniref:Ecp2 effector protein domain-containing protein n=1 Tax=Dendryphion nanum TaxID=256645 RepID=A0A9P9I9J4_9PLEO|nr:hypothetical protein B0J11DRAFT_585279 [Dendryphion nanum]